MSTIQANYLTNLIELSPDNDSSYAAIEEYIDNFFSGISAENIQRQITQSSNGKTDATFVCIKMPDGDELEEPEKFIIKFIYPSLTANYRISTKAFELLGMQVPKFFIFSNETTCYKKTAEKVATIYEFKRPYFMGVMNNLPGADLSQLLTTHAFYKLPSADLKQIFKMWGKISIYDLLIANDDRFFKPDGKPSCNAGNIMLEIPLAQGGKRTLKQMYCIDNASSSILRIIPGSLFTPAKTQYLNKFFELFKACQKSDHSSQFAKQIIEGLKPHFKQLQEFYPEMLIEGMKEAYESLMKLNKESFIQSLKDTMHRTPTSAEGKILCEKIIEHIDRCLILLGEKK